MIADLIVMVALCRVVRSMRFIRWREGRTVLERTYDCTLTSEPDSESIGILALPDAIAKRVARSITAENAQIDRGERSKTRSTVTV